MASPQDGLGDRASSACGDEQALAIQATNDGEYAIRLANFPSRAGDSGDRALNSVPVGAPSSLSKKDCPCSY